MGHSEAVNLDEIAADASQKGAAFVALDEALQHLARLDPRKARTIELRFFGGLIVEETAEVLNISPRASCATGSWLGPGLTANFGLRVECSAAGSPLRLAAPRCSVRSQIPLRLAISPRWRALGLIVRCCVSRFIATSPNFGR